MKMKFFLLVIMFIVTPLLSPSPFTLHLAFWLSPAPMVTVLPTGAPRSSGLEITCCYSDLLSSSNFLSIDSITQSCIINSALLLSHPTLRGDMVARNAERRSKHGQTSRQTALSLTRSFGAGRFSVSYWLILRWPDLAESKTSIRGKRHSASHG